MSFWTKNKPRKSTIYVVYWDQCKKENSILLEAADCPLKYYLLKLVLFLLNISINSAASVHSLADFAL